MSEAGSSRSRVSFCRNNKTTITGLTLQEAGRGNSHVSGIVIAPFPERFFGPKQTRRGKKGSSGTAAPDWLVGLTCAAFRSYVKVSLWE